VLGRLAGGVMVMKLRSIWVVAGVCGGLMITALAQAEEEPEAPSTEKVAPVASSASATMAAASEEQVGGHASGLMVQARVQTQSSLLSLGTGSGFVVGYQGPSYSLGLGLGLTRIGVNSDGQSASVTLLQIAPTVTVDVWHSADGRARANLVGSVGYARASLSATGQSQSCTIDGLGNENCTNTSVDTTASATIIPVMLGFGGDYYLSRNFALGAEFGLQAMFLAGVNASSGSSTNNVDAGANAQFAYGALRATFVLGD
jgi:hypothetical protein